MFDFKKTLIVILLLTITGFFISKIIILNSEKRDLYDFYDKKVSEIENKLVLSLENDKSKIDSLSSEILSLKLSYENQLLKIDSIKIKKSKIRIVYRTKIIEADNFDNQEILNYWKNKFK
jgi:hypothetical protein